MTKRVRYILLAIGFVVFLVFAPLAVLYVSGFSFDMASRQLVKTGILAVRTEPEDVEILLADKVVKEKAGDVKFLKPGEYAVTLQKDGYKQWSKRLQVKEGQVTWASPVPNKLFLFLENNEVANLDGSIQDFFIAGSSIVALTNGSVEVSSISNPSVTENYMATGTDAFIPSPTLGSALLYSKSATSTTVLHFDIGSRKVTNLSGLFTVKPTLHYSDGGDVYALEQGTLYKVDVGAVRKTAITENVIDFVVSFGNLYYLSEQNGVYSFMLLPLNTSQPQLIASNLPRISSGSVFVNPQREVMILLNTTLYRVGSSLEKVADNVSNVRFDQPSSLLLVLHGGELSSYNYQTQRLDFITRTSLPLTNFEQKSSFSLVFLVKNNEFQAVELDLRDHQNEYTFYKGENIARFYIDSEAKTAILLDSGVLKRVRLR